MKTVRLRWVDAADIVPQRRGRRTRHTAGSGVWYIKPSIPPSSWHGEEWAARRTRFVNPRDQAGRRNKRRRIRSLVMANTAHRFDTLVRASPELFRYAMGLCHNRDTAEDLVRDLSAWMAAHRPARRQRRCEGLAVHYPAQRACAVVRAAAPEACVTVLPDIPVRGWRHQRRAASSGARWPARLPDYRDPLLLQVIGGSAAAKSATSSNSTRIRSDPSVRARKALRDLLTG